MAASKERFEQIVESAKFLIHLKIKSHKAELLNEGLSLVDAILLHNQIYGVLERIISFADKRPDVHDALIKACAVQLDIDNELPAPLKNWLVSYLNGEFRRPPASRGRKSGTIKGQAGGLPKIYLGEIAHLLANEYEIKPTRNDASLPLSACDAVAEALVELNLYEAGEGSLGGSKPYGLVKSALTRWRKHQEAAQCMLDDIEGESAL